MQPLQHRLQQLQVLQQEDDGHTRSQKRHKGEHTVEQQLPIASQQRSQHCSVASGHSVSGIAITPAMKAMPHITQPKMRGPSASFSLCIKQKDACRSSAASCGDSCFVLAKQMEL